MNDQFREVKLEVGGIDLERFGFSLEFQNLLRRELPKFFPDISLGSVVEPITLKLVRAGGNNLHWTFSEKNGASYFLKMSFGRGSQPKDQLPSRHRARIRFSSTQNEWLTYEILEGFSCRDGWVILEGLNFLHSRIALDDMLGAHFLMAEMAMSRPSFPRGFSPDGFQIMGKNIAHIVHKVHTFQPSGEMIGAEEYKRFQSSTIRQRMYTEALEDIIDRVNVYMPSRRDNPLVSREYRSRFLRGMKKFSRNWTGRGDRLCLVHGDIQRGNILMTLFPLDPHVVLIDFSPRVQIGEPRWDDGRFVADLLQVYFETKSEHVKVLIDSFIVTSEALSGDKLYRQGLVWGIFSMTLLKFYERGRPIVDREVAKAYLDNSLRIIEDGCFSWPP